MQKKSSKRAKGKERNEEKKSVSDSRSMRWVSLRERKYLNEEGRARRKGMGKKNGKWRTKWRGTHKR